MKYFLIGIWVILSFVMTAELTADTVYTWTDENGKLHITQDPPPKKAKLKETMGYQPPPVKSDLESKDLKEIRAEAERKKQTLDEASKARAEAEKAKKEAERARGIAEETTRMAKEYSESNNPNKIMQQTYAVNAEKEAEIDEEQPKQADD